MRVNIKVVCDPFTLLLTSHRGFTGGLDSKESACHAGDLGFIPGSGRSPGDPLEKATHSSILAWKVPWTESGRLQSMGSQRVGHN